MECPTLGIVPHITGDPLQIKATRTGVTFLHERKYKKRYTGSKQCAVDINGVLYLDAKVLDRKLREGLDKPGKRKVKKKAVAPHCLTTEKNILVQEQMSDSSGDLPNKESKKSYTVNKKEVRQRLFGFLNSQKGKKELYFWTVTFPKGTADHICYQAFNTWLTSLRKYKLLRNYLWVAERQDGSRIDDGRAATNTLHFHIAIPHKMPVKRANAMMAGTLKTFARRGEIPFSSAQCARYNGVDIAKHRTTRRVINFAIKKGARALVGYLTKYVTKNDTEFENLAWHNSRGYSSLFTAVTFTLKEFINFGFRPFLNKCRVFNMEFATFIPWLYGPPPLLEDHLYQLNSHIQTAIDERITGTT
jgi:hypothetical protein